MLNHRNYALVSSLLFLVIPVLVLLVAGCGKKPVPPEDPPKIVAGERFFPMHDGDIWNYTTGVIRKVDGDTTIGGYPCKRVLQASVTSQAWSITSERFAQHLLDGSIEFMPPLAIPLDLQKGTPHEFNSLGINHDAVPGSNDPLQVDSVRTMGTLSFDGYVTRTINNVDLDSCIKLDYDYVDSVYFADDTVEPFSSQYSEYYARGIGLIDDGDIQLLQATIDGETKP